MHMSSVCWKKRPAVLAFLVVLVCLLAVAPDLVSGDNHSPFGEAQVLSDSGFTPLSWFPDGQSVLVSKEGELLLEEDHRHQLMLEIWQLPVNGDAPKRLSDNGVLPALSPDGNNLAFLSYEGAEQWARVQMRIATGEETPVSIAGWQPLLHPTWEEQADGEAGVAVVRWLSPYETDGYRVPSPEGRFFAGASVEMGPLTNLWIEDQIEGTRQVIFDDLNGLIAGISWAPDSSGLLFSRVAPGSQSPGEICWLDLSNGVIYPLFAGQWPLWSPDGTRIAFEHGGRVWLAPVGPGGIPQPVEFDYPDPIEEPVRDGEGQIAGQLVPPETIRVYHSQGNYNHNPNCRPGVPVGQIDLIPFEDYVKRVVPHEIGVSSHVEAIKAQALAVRSYAWWFVLRRAAQSYDVTDWVDFQYMCDATYPATNAAVDATSGQYIAYNGNVILAEYSAENSSPTLPRYLSPGVEHPSYPYLSSVHDPVGFGKTRWGHGRGMSQYGARRWASNHGWSYEHILAHYYFDVTIERPANQSGAPASPAGAVVRPLHGSYLTSRWINLRASASDPDDDVDRVDFYARWLDQNGIEQNTHLGQAQRLFNGWQLNWDTTTIPDQAIQANTITISATARDAGGRQTTLVPVKVGLDRLRPSGTVSSPGYSNQITVTINASPGAAGASGIAGLLLSNNWCWQGELLYHQAASGQTVSDPDALNGAAWYGKAGRDQSGAWYGPYTHVIPEGKPYRAIFRLKTTEVANSAEIAVLDVVDKGGVVLLGLRRLHGQDFLQANTYQEFGVDFWYSKAEENGLEFRVHWKGTQDLYFDRVIVTELPMPAGSAVSWQLRQEQGRQTVQAKFADNAGNVSADHVLLIDLYLDGTTPTPTSTAVNTPTPTTTPTPTVTPTPAPTNQNLSLRQGWNLISLHVVPADNRVTMLTSSLGDALELVLGFSCAEGGLSYYPDLPPGLSTLHHIDVERGYWFKMRRPATWSVTGQPTRSDLAIPLCQGWNLVSYPLTYSVPVTEGLSSIAGSYEAVLGFEDGHGKSFYPSLPPELNSLTLMEPGSGYWIRSQGTGVLIFPLPTASAGIVAPLILAERR